MPTYKNITLSLRSSAHETVPLLEFPPPPGLPGVRIEDARSSTATVYVLASPGLTFWIAYHIKPPAYQERPDVKYFLFKLYMEGRHVVTWAVSEEDEWKGKTMFGLFENEAWRGGVEKRAFAFAVGEEWNKGLEEVDVERDHEERFMEVRVLRASARRRVQRETPKLMKTEVGKEGAGGIELVNAGRLKKENPKRFYEFALVDSLKEPFAKFRYYYRSLDQLETLGVIIRAPESEASEDDEVVIESGHGFDSLDLSFMDNSNDAGTSLTSVEQASSLSHGNAHADASETSSAAVLPSRSGYDTGISGTTDEDTSLPLIHADLSSDPKSSVELGSRAVAPPRRSLSNSSAWSQPKSSLIGMRNSAVVPMTLPESPTMDSAADAALIGALSGQDWLKRTPSPDRTIYRQFDSPAPGASRQGRKSPTGRLKEALKRALRRGES